MLYKVSTKEYKFDKYTILARNLEEAKRIVEEKFKKEEYKINLDSNTPLIIDCGSHIGITSLYFKKIFPGSTILAFEPDFENYKLFKKNMKINNIKKVKCINAALSVKNGDNIMYIRHETESPWIWANSIVKNIWGPNNIYNKEVKIKTKKLSDYINKKVDLLKLDIEGVEQLVLMEIGEKLNLIENVVLEFHGTKYNKKNNNIIKITELLLKNNFQVTITPINLAQNPSEEYKKYVRKVEMEYYILKATKSFVN